MDWVQNSVFEGELTDSQFKRVQHDLKELIEGDEDSVQFYTFRTKDQVKIETLGVQKGFVLCSHWWTNIELRLHSII